MSNNELSAAVRKRWDIQISVNPDRACEAYAHKLVTEMQVSCYHQWSVAPMDEEDIATFLKFIVRKRLDYVNGNTVPKRQQIQKLLVPAGFYTLMAQLGKFVDKNTGRTFRPVLSHDADFSQLSKDEQRQKDIEDLEVCRRTSELFELYQGPLAFNQEVLGRTENGLDEAMLCVVTDEDCVCSAQRIGNPAFAKLAALMGFRLVDRGSYDALYCCYLGRVGDHYDDLYQLVKAAQGEKRAGA